MSTVNSSLRYSSDHEWIDDASPARIGITSYAAEALGDIVFVELPAPGTPITAGEPCGEIESTKSVSELIAPVTGTVAEINEEAVANPGIMNEDPYESGWLLTVDVASTGQLLNAAEYAELTGGDLA